MGLSDTTISIWIGNLGKYNEGALVGEWVDLPCADFSEVFERIGVYRIDEYGNENEPFVADYETPIPGFKISAYPDYEQLNNIAELWEGLDSDEREIVAARMREYGEDVEAAIEKKDDARIWHDCDNMADVAYSYVSEIGGVSELGSNIAEMYFDYAAFGRDIELGGEVYDEAHWNSFDNVADAAYDLVENYFGGISELGDKTLDSYFNYKAFGRDMNYEGTFVDSSDGKSIIELF